MANPELPNHLLYALVFGILVLGAVIFLFIETGTPRNVGRRRPGILALTVLIGLVGAAFLVLNLANIIHDQV